MRYHAATVLAVTLAAVSAAPLAAQRHTLTGSDVAIYNLAGTITVSGTAAGDIVATVRPQGRDARDLRIETGRVGGSNALRVYADADRIIYPELGRGSRSTLRVSPDGTFFDAAGLDLVRTRNVTIAGSGRGVQAYADIDVAVPPGRTIRLYAAVGRVDVQNVDGEIHVRTSSARSELRDVRGAVHLRTSSGGATIRDVNGSVRATGSSGRIRMTNVRGGHQEVQTSSGSIEATNVTGDVVRLRASSGTISGGTISGGDIEMRASSGSIRIDGLDADRYNARTSSGRITARNLTARHIDVGASSGTIELSAGSALESLTAQASSGSVRAAIPRSFTGDVAIRTGSGSINIDLPVVAQSMRRNELIGRIGEGGSGSLNIRTSSGSVRITTS
jgi:lia operon protein LiaG